MKELLDDLHSKHFASQLFKPSSNGQDGDQGEDQRGKYSVTQDQQLCEGEFGPLVGSERELDLKGFCNHTGHNYSDDIYKVETIKPRKVSHNEFVISRAFVWVQGKHGLSLQPRLKEPGPGHYE